MALTENKTITFRVHGWWMGPLITVWSTVNEKEFEDYCLQWKFSKNDQGTYVNNEGFHETWLEIQ